MRLFAACCVLIMMGCTVAPEEIAYGSDACHFCKMNIVDDRFASEIVSTTGKVYKFDAVECMINFTNTELPSERIALQLVTTYDRHGQFVDASEATYLRSPKVPSPMGMYITPYQSREGAKNALEQNGGNTMSWEELTTNFERLPSLAE